MGSLPFLLLCETLGELMVITKACDEPLWSSTDVDDIAASVRPSVIYTQRFRLQGKECKMWEERRPSYTVAQFQQAGRDGVAATLSIHAPGIDSEAGPWQIQRGKEHGSSLYGWNSSCQFPRFL
jgi:hypothetical protein